MFNDPETFDISTLKQYQMYPSTTMISRGIIPYINRIKKHKIKICVVGDVMGHTIVDILENCPNVSRVFVFNNYDGIDNPQVKIDLFNKNTEKFKSKLRFHEPNSSSCEIVCIDQSACISETLSRFYTVLKPSGIFAGNGHEYVPVKEELNKFRRFNKIGIPIMVSNRAVWFWYKR